jgi:hypothetical protein
MGKTSTLNQLPRLLSARYLPIYYDLQLRGVSSNSAAFLSTVAEEMAVAYPSLRVDGHYMIVQAQFGLFRISTLSEGYATIALVTFASLLHDMLS